MSFDVHRLPVRLRKLPGSQQIHADPVGAYLRALGAIDPPARLTIHQGDDLGRPSLLLVDVPVGLETGIRVSGRAVPIDQVQDGSSI